MKRDLPAVEKLLRARRAGLTLRQAAAAAGVHVATVCRWQARDPDLRRALLAAAREHRASQPLPAPGRASRGAGAAPNAAPTSS